MVRSAQDRQAQNAANSLNTGRNRHVGRRRPEWFLDANFGRPQRRSHVCWRFDEVCPGGVAASLWQMLFERLLVDADGT